VYSLCSGHSVDRYRANESTTAKSGSPRRQDFSVTVRFRSELREPALAEQPRTYGGTFSRRTGRTSEQSSLVWLKSRRAESP
jgi:hypothetical protein